MTDEIPDDGLERTAEAVVRRNTAEVLRESHGSTSKALYFIATLRSSTVRQSSRMHLLINPNGIMVEYRDLMLRSSVSLLGLGLVRLKNFVYCSAPQFEVRVMFFPVFQMLSHAASQLHNGSNSRH